VKRKGFTLIELLVVIAIIAILAAILFPVFARARAKALQNTCLSNVKQITLGLQMYIQDYDQYLPCNTYWAIQWYGYTGGLVYWTDAVQPYIKNTQIWVCPEDRTRGQWGRIPVVSYAIPAGYKYSSGMYYWDDGSGANVTWFQNPAELIMLAEAPPTWSCPFGIGCGYSPTWQLDQVPWNHNAGLNLGFADGHVKWTKPQTLKDANWYY